MYIQLIPKIALGARAMASLTPTLHNPNSGQCSFDYISLIYPQSAPSYINPYFSIQHLPLSQKPLTLTRRITHSQLPIPRSSLSLKPELSVTAKDAISPIKVLPLFYSPFLPSRFFHINYSLSLFLCCASICFISLSTREAH